MNAIRVSIVVACLTALSTFAQSAKPLGPADFSGTWEFNAGKSKNVGMMAAMKMTADVKQTATDLSITNTTVFNNQPGTSETRYDLTGKSVTNTSPMEGPSETISKWDGKKLVTTWTSPGSVAGTTTVRTETRSISEDGRTMTVDSKRGKSASTVMVYDRK